MSAQRTNVTVCSPIFLTFCCQCCSCKFFSVFVGKYVISSSMSFCAPIWVPAFHCYCSHLTINEITWSIVKCYRASAFAVVIKPLTWNTRSLSQLGMKRVLAFFFLLFAEMYSTTLNIEAQCFYIIVPLNSSFLLHFCSRIVERNT